MRYVSVCCEGFSNCSNSVVVVITGIDTNQPSVIKIFPNPATSFLKIESSGVKGDFYLTNCVGREFRRGETNSNQYLLDISTLPGGLYFLKIVTEERISVFKIMKE